jgi:D-alanyl-lipoteichoic acid acyltransferase DltB (MBOAT superfamily)
MALITTDLMGFIVPFALTFALSLGALTVSGVFDKQKQVNFIIAIALAILAVSSPSYSKMIYTWAPILATLFIVVFVLVFLRKSFGKEAKADWTTLIAIAILFLLLMQIGPSIPLPSGSTIKSDDIILVAGIMLVIAIIVIGKALSKGEGAPATPPRPGN